jgi:GDP/UDP-N,N'-diacetylbacillosamine 2-epimerase (hydrolysing)
MRRRVVLASTGIRSEYFLQRPIFQAIRDHADLELKVVVTGAHLSPLHGYTVRTIEADGFPIAARIESLLYADRDAARLKGAALQLQVLAHVVDELRPDWLLAACDREEALALAVTGAYLGLPIAHYGAGDHAVGNVDDSVRHAVSRLAHLLLTISEASRERLLRSGESAARVHCVGHSGIDRIRTAPALDPDSLAARLGVSALVPPYLIVVQHPLSSESGAAGEQMRETLEAVALLGLQTFVSYPNSDAGGQAIVRAIEEYRRLPNLHVFRNVPDDSFVALLRGALALVGNSSMGLLEAPFLRLAAINVGHRQQGREHAENAFFVPAERNAIAAAVRAVREDESVRERVRTCRNPFGDGHTGAKVADLLATVPVDAALLNKEWS